MKWALAIVTIIIGVSGIAPAQAFAALEVSFSNEPLFAEADVKPGDAYRAAIAVTNTGPDAEDVQFELENTFSDGLAEVLELSVSSSSALYFDGFLDEAFAAGEIELGALGANETRVYELIVAIASSVGNEYELTNTGFDLRIGFAGGETETDAPGGSGGGGGGSATRPNSDELEIFNEEAQVIGSNSAALEWNTNLPADSYAVCGDLTNGPFSLSVTPPLFGYEFVFGEEAGERTDHRLTADEVDFGSYECRVASREATGDAYTVSTPIEFTLAPEGQVAGESIDAPTPQPFAFDDFFAQQGAGGTGGKGGLGMMTYDEFHAELDARRALASTTELGASSTVETADLATTAADDRIIDSTETDDNSALPEYWWVAALAAMLVGGGYALFRRV